MKVRLIREHLNPLNQLNPPVPKIRIYMRKKISLSCREELLQMMFDDDILLLFKIEY